MADVFSEQQRSWIMSRIHGSNTRPELQVRKVLHAMGFRYRLHYSKLPGKPDIALPGRKKAIFVHGCFWHGHPDCPRSKLPSTNVEFWKAKIGRTMERDRENAEALARLGWEVLVLWSCETRRRKVLIQKLEDFLNGPIEPEQ
ncbi:MAG TPA: very short patch repair endonuclease [Syntrophobacteraceae bacterium]|nr:very short patch repair endonuclease [Syntrophobacteraceae bacterium]